MEVYSYEPSYLESQLSENAELELDIYSQVQDLDMIV